MKELRKTGCGTRILEFVGAIILCVVLQKVALRFVGAAPVASLLITGWIWLFLIVLRNLVDTRKHPQLRANAAYGAIRIQLVLTGLLFTVSFVRLFASLAAAVGAGIAQMFS